MNNVPLCLPGIRRKMYVKLAAKLLVIAWTLMRRGDRFRSEAFMD